MIKQSEELADSVQVAFTSDYIEDLKEPLLVSEMKTLMKEILTNSDITTLNVEKHEPILKQYLNQVPDIQAIWSSQSDGTFIFSEPEAGLLNAKHRPWFIEAMQQGEYT